LIKAVTPLNLEDIMQNRSQTQKLLCYMMYLYKIDRVGKSTGQKVDYLMLRLGEVGNGE
jgi:hypothetical protein